MKTLNNMIREISNSLFKKSQEIRFSLLDIWEDMENTIMNSDNISKEEMVSKMQKYQNDIYTIKESIDDLT